MPINHNKNFITNEYKFVFGKVHREEVPAASRKMLLCFSVHWHTAFSKQKPQFGDFLTQNVLGHI